MVVGASIPKIVGPPTKVATSNLVQNVDLGSTLQQNLYYHT